MGFESEAEKGSNSSYDTPKLPLFSASHAILSHMQMQSPERSGMLTPPLHASASVPFRWEEEPGKPKPCTALTTFCNNPNDFASKCLELPPRLLLLDHHAKINNTNNKLPSPTTVLEGPYMGKARFQSSSFRMGGECYGSFRAGDCSPDHQMVQLKTMMLSKRGYKEKGFLGRSWRRRTWNKSRREVGGNSYVFPSSGDKDSECSKEEGEESNSSTSVKITRIRRAGSFSSLSHSPKSHFWASIYEGLKQVVPWSKREKKDGFMG